jgi:hemerythrin
MEFTRWTERYSVGDPLMDAYHHIFFKTLEDFARELAELAPAAVEERIAFLLNYAGMHFDSEEQLMREVAYPELEAHQELHRTFKERLKVLQDRYLALPSSGTAQELLALSEAWLREHILGEDMKYKPFLKR